MSRSLPSADLQFCETQVVVKAVLSNGQTLRLGTAELTNIPESDGNQYSYTAKIVKDSEVNSSTTQTANQMSFDAENVDKVLGLSINDLNATLHGAKVVASKVFANPVSMNLLDFNPHVWYEVGNIKNTLPNEQVTILKDQSGNNFDATGTSTLKWKKINGIHALRFTTNDSMVIPGSFKAAQVFAVFTTPSNVFSSSGSILGSADTPFSFVSGTSNFDTPFPQSVRSNGEALTSPFDLGNLTQVKIINVRTNNPTNSRSYQINNQSGIRTDLNLSELLIFENALSGQQEQLVEYILAKKFGVLLPYALDRMWESKVLLSGQISEAQSTEEAVSINIVSDIAPNVAFFANRSVSEKCPLVFKGTKCGYVGSLVSCNKLYESNDGCAGRNNQHRFQGVVVKGELPAPIPGDIDTTIGYGGRQWMGDHFPDAVRNREFIF